MFYLFFLILGVKLLQKKKNKKKEEEREGEMEGGEEEEEEGEGEEKLYSSQVPALVTKSHGFQGLI